MKAADILYIIFHASFWEMNYKYSASWDYELNELMRKERFVLTGSCKAKIGNRIVWIASHPFASFHPYDNKSLQDARPSRTTIRRAREKLERDTNEDLFSCGSVLKYSDFTRTDLHFTE